MLTMGFLHVGIKFVMPFRYRKISLALCSIGHHVQHQEDEHMQNDAVEEHDGARCLVTQDELAHAESDLVIWFEVHVSAQSLFLVEGGEGVELLFILRGVPVLYIHGAVSTACWVALQELNLLV